MLRWAVYQKIFKNIVEHDFFWEGGGILPQNSYKTCPGSMRNYNVKENCIGSAVSEILWYWQTDRHLITEIIGAMIEWMTTKSAMWRHKNEGDERRSKKEKQ